MKVTEVRVKLNLSPTDRLRGFCSITLENSFAIRDIKIIEGPSGLFVAMPSRKSMDHCPRCRGKNHLRAKFCNNCGTALNENRHSTDESRQKFHCDVAHPINAASRAAVQEAILRTYAQELERSRQPGYVPQKFEDVGEDYEAVPVPS
jgi:stage V sporulation protein G